MVVITRVHRFGSGSGPPSMALWRLSGGNCPSVLIWIWTSVYGSPWSLTGGNYSSALIWIWTSIYGSPWRLSGGNCLGVLI